MTRLSSASYSAASSRPKRSRRSRKRRSSARLASCASLGRARSEAIVACGAIASSTRRPLGAENCAWGAASAAGRGVEGAAGVSPEGEDAPCGWGAGGWGAGGWGAEGWGAAACRAPPAVASSVARRPPIELNSRSSSRSLRSRSASAPVTSLPCGVLSGGVAPGSPDSLANVSVIAIYKAEACFILLGAIGRQRERWAGSCAAVSRARSARRARRPRSGCARRVRPSPRAPAPWRRPFPSSPRRSRRHDPSACRPAP